MLYTVLKFVHILLAIIAVGFTSTFGLLSVRAAKIGGDGREMMFALKAIVLMSSIAHACFLLLLATGLLDGLGGRLPLHVHVDLRVADPVRGGVPGRDRS